MRIARPSPHMLLAAVLSLVALNISCGGDSTAPATRYPVRLIQVGDGYGTSVEIGTTRKIPVTFNDGAGHAAVPHSVVFSVETPQIATVTPDGTVTGLKVGATSLHVHADDVQGYFILTVTPVAVMQITGLVSSFAMSEGDSTHVPPMTLIDRIGATITNRQTSYTTSNPAIVDFGGDPNGTLLRAHTPGTATVTVRVDSATAQFTVDVAALPIGTMHTTPSLAYVGVGRALHTQTTATSVSGLHLTRTYTYTSADPAIAMASATGVIQGVHPGQTTITISTVGGSTTVPVSVAQLGMHAFQIDVRFVGNVPSTVRSAAMAAAARWDSVVTAGLVPYRVSVGANTCGTGTPAMNEVVPNTIIYVVADSVDGRGSTAGVGGPCVIRDDAPQLTALGSLRVDTADVTNLVQTNTLVDLLTHEMGHILGLGTLWGTSWFPNTAVGLGTGDPRFIGHAARLGASALAFTSDTSEGVPIENSGGDGTRDGHWRATLFGHELMTGTLHLGGNPLSLVTIQALADLGYTVAPEAADDFTALNANAPSTFPSATGDRSIPIRERVLPPLFTTTREGVRTTIPPRLISPSLRQLPLPMR